MDLSFSADEETFRAEARHWLDDRLTGKFAGVRGVGGPGNEHVLVEERIAWERELGAHRWSCLSFPERYGGRGASLLEQVIFYEEYARAGGPGRAGIVGEGLIGPTILAFGTEAQRSRFLPRIASGEELWCQGYSEPNAGSDLANVATRAEIVAGPNGDEWSITGQKTWTSLAQYSDWCFALCRTDRDAPRHRGISYLLVPMHQEGIELRPIRQLTATSEFNEVFLSDARTGLDNIVGEVNAGWRVAMGTLAFERGASTLGQQLTFDTELAAIIEAATTNGAARGPVMRQRIADAWIRLRIMRYTALRSLSAMGRGELTPQTAIHKLYWATLHRELGELAVDVAGSDALVADAVPYELSDAQRLFLWTRADTIYGGSNQVQRNIIGERVLGLPPEPKVRE